LATIDGADGDSLDDVLEMLVVDIGKHGPVIGVLDCSGYEI
jgi:hypothetical protein